MPHGIELIVVNYRSPGDLGHHLQSLERHAPTGPWHLSIVNVDPHEEDDNVAQTWQTRIGNSTTLVRFDENVGYARAVNLTASLAQRYDTFGIFNADTRFLANVIDDCMSALWSQYDWGVLGPGQVDDRNLVTHAGVFGTLQNRIERAFHQPWSTEYQDVRDDAITVSGSAYFIKRAVWDLLTECPEYQWASAEGAFLPTRHYYEETWCSYHAIAHGYKIVYYGPATMIHHWHRASKVGSVERFTRESHDLFDKACSLHNIEL